jgi:phospholipase/carboxylesterase
VTLPAPALNHAIEWLPEDGSPPQQLLLLLHGWRSEGTALAPLAQALRAQFPQAAVLAPDAPTRFGEHPTQRLWYGIDGLTPENWPARVAGCLPPLHAWVKTQQQRLGVGEAATALGGFSQGAILALALVLKHDGLAGRVLSFGGCFTARPEAAPRLTTLHFFHGGDDEVIPADGSRQALAWLAEMEGDATLDIAQGIAHELHPVLIERALWRLTHHIPLRTWQQALGAQPRSSAG